MSEFTRAVVLNGEKLAAFQNEGQARYWISEIAKAARVPESNYTTEAISLSGSDEAALNAYKRQVYDTVQNYASDASCSTVQGFLRDVGIDPEDYASEEKFLVTVKFDGDTQGSVEPYEIDGSIRDGARFDFYNVEVERA